MRGLMISTGLFIGLSLGLLTGIIGCSKDVRYLHNKIVTDSFGCKYIVRHNLGDTAFINKLQDQDCKEQK